MKTVWRLFLCVFVYFPLTLATYLLTGGEQDRVDLGR